MATFRRHEVSSQTKIDVFIANPFPFAAATWREISKTGTPRQRHAKFSYFPQTLTCKFCAQQFTPKGKANRRTGFCSKPCRKNHKEAIQKEKADAKQTRQNARLAARRRYTYMAFDGRDAGGQDRVHGA